MWRIALASCLVTLALMGVVKWQSDRIAALRAEQIRLEQALKTHERIRDADVGIGDVDDDTRWLCERAGGRDCGAGLAP